MSTGSRNRVFSQGLWETTIPYSGHTDQGGYGIIGRESLLRSEGHRWPPKAGSVSDIGGNFLVVKNEYEESSSIPSTIRNKVSEAPSSTLQYYTGPQYARSSSVLPSSGLWPAPIIPSDSSMNALGTTLISRVLPTNPNAGLATFVGELKNDGLPKLIGSDLFKKKVFSAKRAGSEYLNFEFGWKPLVNDLLKFGDSVRNADKILAQYERNSGRQVRRRISMPVTHAIQDNVYAPTLSYPSPVLSTSYYGGLSGRGTRTSVRQTSQRKWFSGCFTYYLDLGSDTRSKIRRFTQEANKLFGVRLTPEVVWDLAPWSWAADWVGNLGDVFHNVSAFSNDGLIMRYGYVMHEIRVTDVHTLSGIWITSTQSRESCSQSFTTVVKKRMKATPFGFGLNPEVDFTSRQWAIVGALGLSRSGNQL